MGAGPEAFSFGEFSELTDGVLDGRVEALVEADDERGIVPAYEFGLYLADGSERVGRIGLRVADTPWILTYAGHVGYEIEPQYRGRRFAARACRLVVAVAKHHGLTTLWLTVTPDNAASRRVCDQLGAVLVDIVDLPPDCDMYRDGERQKCRYRWDLPRD